MRDFAWETTISNRLQIVLIWQHLPEDKQWWISFHQGLMEMEWIIVLADSLWDKIKKHVINARGKIPFTWREKSLKSKRRKGNWEIIGMYCLEKSYILISVKANPNTKICKVWQVCSLKVKKKKNQRMEQFSIHLCLFSQIKEEFIILTQKKKEING